MANGTTVDGSTDRVLGGKVGIVTGSSKGIGRELACGPPAAGAAVVVNYKHDDAGTEETVRRIAAAGGEAVTLQADVGDSEEALRLVEETFERFGQLCGAATLASRSLRAC